MSDCMTQEDAMNMNNEQAIQILKPMQMMMRDQHGCPISDAYFALGKALEALEAFGKEPKWIPVKFRPMDKEEKQYWEEHYSMKKIPSRSIVPCQKAGRKCGYAPNAGTYGRILANGMMAVFISKATEIGKISLHGCRLKNRSRGKGKRSDSISVLGHRMGRGFPAPSDRSMD